MLDKVRMLSIDVLELVFVSLLVADIPIGGTILAKLKTDEISNIF